MTTRPEQAKKRAKNPLVFSGNCFTVKNKLLYAQGSTIRISINAIPETKDISKDEVMEVVFNNASRLFGNLNL